MQQTRYDVVVKTDHRECSAAQISQIQDFALDLIRRSAPASLVIDQGDILVSTSRKKPHGKITFSACIVAKSKYCMPRSQETTQGPMYDCLRKAIAYVLGAQKPIVKAYTAMLRSRKADNPEIQAFINAVIADAEMTASTKDRTIGIPPAMVAPYGHASALFTPEKLDREDGANASARENSNEGPTSLMMKAAAIRINNLRRDAKLDSDALKIIAPDGNTIIVNGHLVKKGITRAEYDAMPVKPADLWLARVMGDGSMAHAFTWLSPLVAQNMEKGLVHLNKKDAERHAMALFTPDDLDREDGANA